MTIREISFKYDMLDEDIAKIIHVMLFNKNRNNFKYNFIVIPAKNDNEFVLKCKQLGIKLDKYINSNGISSFFNFLFFLTKTI